MLVGVRNFIDAADVTNLMPEGMLNTVSGAVTGGGYVGSRWSDADPTDWRAAPARW